MNVGPYGPATPSIRRFLVGLAAMEADAHADALQRWVAISGTDAYHVADAAVGALIERSGRGDARDALGGPLMAMMQLPVPTATDSSIDATASSHVLTADESDPELTALDPLAEPALGALLALLVRDLLTPAQFSVLYSPFAAVIPTASLL